MKRVDLAQTTQEAIKTLISWHFRGDNNLKRLAIATVAGLVSFAGQSAAQAETTVVPIVDTVNDENANQLTKRYKLTEIIPTDTNNLAPNVVSYYNSTDKTTHYYAITFTQSEYGTGSQTKYFKWSTNGTLTATEDSTDAVITIHYDEGQQINKYFAGLDKTIAEITDIYVGADIKGILEVTGVASTNSDDPINSRAGHVGTITSDFVGNSTTISASDSNDYTYSTIITGNSGSIDKIDSAFIGNMVSIDAENSKVNGPLVKVLGRGVIDNLESEFIGNIVSSTAQKTQLDGGLIKVDSNGKINNLKSDFIRNKATTNSGVDTADESALYGVIMSTAGNVTIENSRFIENSGESAINDKLTGGTIYAAGGSDLLIKDSIFVGNSLKSGSTVYGGAIYNAGNLKVENTLFTNNSVQGKDAKGGAIYTTQDLTISATDGGLTEFTNNYTLKNGVKDYEAIYVDNKNNSTLTLSATEGGHILFNDKITGSNPYNLVLTGDNTGTISLYNTITNANVTAKNTNIDFADGNVLTYNLLTLIANDTAKWTIDVDFTNKQADTFRLGSGSSGTIYISDLNVLGKAPTTAQIIQIVTGSDSVSIGLDEALVDKYHKTTVRERATSDDLKQSAQWGDQFGAHKYEDTIEEGLRTATKTNQNDSIEYYVETRTKDLGVDSAGDTMMLLNQAEQFGTNGKKFKAKTSTDSYTVGADLGKTYGTFTVEGYSSSDKNTLDANQHTLFEVGEGAKVSLNYLTINNLKDVDGSLLTIDEGGSATLRYVDVNGNEGSAAIVNDGSLTLSGGTLSKHNIFKGGGIIGSGTTTINSSSYWEFSNGSLQDTILSSSYSYLYLGDNMTLNGVISGSGYTYLKDNSTLTTNADNLRTIFSGVTDNGWTNGSVLNLTGGTIDSNIYSVTMNILGDVKIGDNGRIGGMQRFYTRIKILNGGSLTTDASTFIGSSSIYTSFTNDGVFNLTGGTFSYNNGNISGTGTTNILGDVTLFNSSSFYVYNNIHVLDGGKLTINGASIRNGVMNDSELRLTGGDIGNGYLTDLNGKGKTYIDGNVYAYYTNFNQDVEILEGKSLSTNWNRKFTNLLNNGTLTITNSDTTSDRTSDKSHGIWSQAIRGEGTLSFKGDSSSNYLYLDNQAQINSNLTISNYARVWTDAGLLGREVTINGYSSALYLTGGILNNKISGTNGSLYIDTGVDVVSNAIIYSTNSNFLTLNNNSSLTISADNLQTNATLNSGSNLYLKSGTWGKNVSGSSGTVTILSDNEVTHTSSNKIASNVNVQEGAKFTVSASNLTGTVTNDGDLYLSGLLSRKYLGSGTTYIDKELHIKSGAGFPATFDLNHGRLVSDEIASYTFGHTTNSGDLIFNINASLTQGATGANDNFTLASSSNAIFDIADISFGGVYSSASFANTVKTYQVLKGGSNSYLTLGEIIEKDIPVYYDWRDILGDNIYTDHPENVYFDDPYNNHETSGTVHASVELATTDKKDDSVKVTYGDFIYENKDIRIDLLSDWNQYSGTTEIKNFNFRTSDDVYTSLASVGTTYSLSNTPLQININGVSTTTTDAEGNSVINRSVIDLNGYSGFNMGSTNQNIINLENVEFRNSNGYVFQTNNDVFGTKLDDGTIQGGIVNCLFKDNTWKTPTQSFGTLYFGNNTLVHQIKDSVFDSNSSSLSSSSTSLYSYSGVIYNSGTISEILNSIFSNNSSSCSAGSSFSYSGTISNYNIISKISNSTFENNSSESENSYAGSSSAISYSGVIYNSGTISEILKSTFSGNSSYSYRSGTSGSSTSYSGVIYNSKTIDKMQGSTFSNNSSSAKSSAKSSAGSSYAGAIYNSGTISEILKGSFSGNSSSAKAKSYSGAIYNSGTISEIQDSIFSGNSSASDSSSSYSGVIYNSGTISEILNSIFSGNSSASSYSTSSLDSYSGAIYNSGKIGEILNSTFSGNFSSAFYSYSGAIYNEGTIKISARGSVDENGEITEGLTEFTDNWADKKGETLTADNNVALYLSGSGSSTTLNAETYGTILMNDKIKGDAAANLILTGNNTGTIKLFDTVLGALNVTAEKTNITTANGKIGTWSLTDGGLSSDETAKWTIDIDFVNNQADTFDVLNGTGTMYLDNLNVLDYANKYTKVRVLNKTVADTLELALNSDKYNIVTDVRDTLSDTVYADEIYHQDEGYAVSSSYAWNTNTYGIKDSISQCIDEDLDALNLVTGTNKHEIRNFVFRDGGTYTVTENLDDIYAGTLNIQGLAGDTITSTIDADGHSMFKNLNEDDNVTLNISDVHVTGADNDDVIQMYTYSNKSSSVRKTINLSNTIIDGNIKNTYATSSTYDSQNLHINIDGRETTLNGSISGNVKATLKSGKLRLAENTFADSNTYLTINDGTLALNNDGTETYNIYNLTPGTSGKLAIDVDLSGTKPVSDMLNVTSSSGVITLTSIDFINGVPSAEGTYKVQVLKNGSSSTLQLAIDDSIKHIELDDFSEIRADQVGLNTDFNQEFHNRKYTGTLKAELELATTNKTNDSIQIKISSQWNDGSEELDKLGDTLYMVNAAELETRNFNSQDSNDVYTATVDLDETAQGNLNLNGTLERETGNRSTIRFKNHRAFHLGDDTTLTVQDVRLTGTKDLITVDGEDTTVVLNDAYINGNIVGNERFDLNINGTETTTILGKVTNSDVVFSNGGLVIAENTFADDSVFLEVKPNAYVHLNDDDISNYTISHIDSSASSKYGLDVDLANEKADTIISNGVGKIVFESFNIVDRKLANINKDKDFTIRILYTDNDSLQLAISETVQQQLKTIYKLGTVHEIIKMDKVQAVADWGTKWEVTEGDYDVYGKIELGTSEGGTTNDSLRLFGFSTELRDQTTHLGDTLMLMSIFETDQDRRFYTDSASDRYLLTEDIGSMSSGQMTLDGKTDTEGNHSTIDMNGKKGFKLDNNTHLIANDVTFENAGYKDGSLFTLLDADSVLDLNNVTITDTLSTNAIKNNATVNMIGGTILLYSGITGEGVTNITGGANVEIFDGMSITQDLVHVQNGYLTLNKDSIIYGALKIGTEGTVKTETDGITTEVENDGHIIFTNGLLSHDITGEGTTVVVGNVVNAATIDQDVDVEEGVFTTKADKVGGTINNQAVTNLSGRLTNVVTGDGTTVVDTSLRMGVGAGIDGTMELNDGFVYTNDGEVADYNIGTMSGYGIFNIDIDLDAKRSDKFIVGNQSSGTVYLDKINFSGDLGEFETFKIQVLDTHKTDAIQLALSDAMAQGRFAVGTTTMTENDLRARVYYNELFHDKTREGTIYATVRLADTGSKNDSIELVYSDTVWGAVDSVARKDTLKELTRYATIEDKEFEFKAADNKYTVKEDLGEATAGNFDIIGVADGDKRSTIDFTDGDKVAHSGWELNNETNLTIRDVEVKNAKNRDVITSSNSKARVNLHNVTFNGNIRGTGNRINITGEGNDVTTLNGLIVNANTTFDGGTLRFNTDTFGAVTDTLDVLSGRVDLQDSAINTYEVTKLTSNEVARYSIDLDTEGEKADKIVMTNTSSSGIVYIDDINIVSTAAIMKEFIAQVLDTNNNNKIQIRLTEEVKSKIYDFGKEEERSDDLKADVNFDEDFHDIIQEIILKGHVVEATKDTENDSIALKITDRINGDVRYETRLDTLKELTQYKTKEEKFFRFKTSKDGYTVKDDLGEAQGKVLNIVGVSEGDSRSTIDFKDSEGYVHGGFELVNDTTLNITDVELKTQRGEDVIASSNSKAKINFSNVTMHGNISGSGNAINITGKGTDVTTLDGVITNADTTFDGGTLRFNTDTFADKDDTLDVVSGRVDMQDGKAEVYEVQKLTSDEEARYSIDVDLGADSEGRAPVSDMINITDKTSDGIVFIDEINFMNGEMPMEFIVQVLKTNGNNNIRIKLSKEIKDTIYEFGKTQREWDDLKSSVYFDEVFSDYVQDGVFTGSIKEATTNTVDDSIELVVSGTKWGDITSTERKDTLKELTQYKAKEDKNFRFRTAGDSYTVKEDLGEATDGTFNIVGVADGTNRSEIDFTDSQGVLHSGFELANDTTLNITDVEMSGAKYNTLIDVTNEAAKVNLSNVTLHGNIHGTQTAISITGEGTDVTTLDGVITNSNTTFDGGTLRFNTNTFADQYDTLDVISGRVDLQDSKISTYEVTKLTSNAQARYSIDVDLGNKEQKIAPSSDMIQISDGTSKGIVFIDNINYIRGDLPTKFIVQVLETNGNNNIQIQLSDKIKETIYDFGKTSETRDDLRADVFFNETFHDYYKEGDMKGSIKEATTATTNDSIELEIDTIVWGEEVATDRKDTLKELTQFDTTEDKKFRFTASDDSYTVKEDLGEATAGKFDIVGVADGDERSTIDFFDKSSGEAHSGFELANDTTLNLSDVEMKNAKHNTLISSTDAEAEINLENVTMHGNIHGAGNDINITGGDRDVTTLDGVITNADTTFDGGTLRFNTDTFADENDSLDVVSGRVDLQDSKVDTYEVNKLTSSKDASYSIDIDLGDNATERKPSADLIRITDENSSGIVYIDDINFMNGELPLEFIVQILETNGNDQVQIKLSDEIKSTIYDFGKTSRKWNDLKADVDYDEFFHDYYQEGEMKASIKEATTHTTNDSIALKVEEINWGDVEKSVRIDTLHEIADYVVESDKTFNFRTSEDVYKSKAHAGEVHGTLSINGVKDENGYSTVNFKKYRGFELVEDSKLNVNNTVLTNAADGILITARDSSAEVTLNNSQVDGSITGVKGYTVNITGDEDHIFNLKNDIRNANINIDTVRVDVYDTSTLLTSNVDMNSGILNMTADHRVSNLTSKSFDIGGTFEMMADVDLRSESMDKLPSNTTIVDGATLNVTGLNLLTDTLARTVAVPFAYKGFKDQVLYLGNGELSKETQITEVYAPIYKYNVYYDNRDDMGYFVFNRQGAGGNASDNFNPAVLPTPVANQAAGNASITETFRYVFEHADAFTQLPEAIRTVRMNSDNRYALSTEFNENLGSLCIDHDSNKAGWFRAYTTFENLNLENGPKVSAITYGSLAGYDTDFRHLRRGWHNVGTGYIGYMGSQLDYSGVNTTMNGGLIGLTETFYKGNFWTAITASVGAGVANTSTMYGKEDTVMMMAGLASKTGYNFEFQEGKYIFQPIMMLSYTFVNTFDYTNAAGLKIDSDPMHSIQLNPSMRFIANMKNGWQPYAQVGMVWNLMNETKVTANGTPLPNMHTKPYVEYGVGLQRNWGDKFTAFGQAMVRNGGRNGIALTAGFRWALGRDVEHVHQEKVENSQPTRKIVKQQEKGNKTVNGKQNNKTTRTTSNANTKKI